LGDYYRFEQRLALEMIDSKQQMDIEAMLRESLRTISLHCG
jgi:hypothetical protein